MKLNVFIKSAIIIVLSTLGLTQLAIAAPKPAKCPAANVIIKAGLSIVERDDEDGVYIVGQINQYKTPQRWAFLIGVPLDQAVSPQDAKNKATASLATLRGNPQPQQMQQDVWVCMYDNKYNYISFAVEPININAKVYSEGNKMALLHKTK